MDSGAHVDKVKQALAAVAANAHANTISAARQIDAEREGAVYEIPAVVRVAPWGWDDHEPPY